MSGAADSITRLAVHGDPSGWVGLPPVLPAGDVTSAFPRDSTWSGIARLGRRRRELAYFWTDIPGDGGKLRVWIEGDRVVLLDLPRAGLQAAGPGSDARRLEDLFQEHPTALDTWRDTVPMPASELVFPAHGLAAFISPDTGAVWHLALFAPATLESYEDELRIDLRVRRVPLARR